MCRLIWIFAGHFYILCGFFSAPVLCNFVHLFPTANLHVMKLTWHAKTRYVFSVLSHLLSLYTTSWGERGGSVVECRTPEREVRGSRPTAAVLCPWARYFTPRKYWLITQEAMAPSRHDWKIVDWDVKPQHNQPTNTTSWRSRMVKWCIKWKYYFVLVLYQSSKFYPHLA